MTSFSGSSTSSANVDCAQLEKYLKSGMWKTADQETRKLIYLACGADPSNRAMTPSVDQIPCEDLQAIDALWMKYSKGRFGFSAQRPIWDACKQKFFDKTDVWNGFGSRVGWRVNHLLKQNYWKEQSELTFSIQAPVGHFPHMGKQFSILTIEAFLNRLTYCVNPPEEY